MVAKTREISMEYFSSNLIGTFVTMKSANLRWSVRQITEKLSNWENAKNGKERFQRSFGLEVKFDAQDIGFSVCEKRSSQFFWQAAYVT